MMDERTTVSKQSSIGREGTRQDRQDPSLSVVLPAYNERENVRPLAEELRDVLIRSSNPKLRPFEIIFVDDGSDDRTRDELQSLAQEHSELIAIFLQRNFGQSAALAAGIDAASGEIVVTMDADGQNDPKDIPDLVATLEEGYDCVSGWRTPRNDPLRKRIPSAIQTHLAQLTGPKIHDFGCTLKAYRREVLADIELYGERHRYIPAQLHKQGYRITEQEVNHRPRIHGQSKYGFNRLVKGIADLMFVTFWNRYSTRPFHFLGGLGFSMMGAGFVIGMHAVISKYAFGMSLVPKTPRLILTIGLVLLGFQIVMFGFIAEMFTQLYYRTNRPYRLRTIYNGDD